MYQLFFPASTIYSEILKKLNWVNLSYQGKKMKKQYKYLQYFEDLLDVLIKKYIGKPKHGASNSTLLY